MELEYNKMEYLDFRYNEIYLLKLANEIKIGTDWSENEMTTIIYYVYLDSIMHLKNTCLIVLVR